LTVHLWIYNNATLSGEVNKMDVEVLSTTSQLLATLATFSNLDGETCTGSCPTEYVTYTYDMTPYIGQTVLVRFHGPSSSMYGSIYFNLDDITLTTP
jgi:hypothetical protein